MDRNTALGAAAGVGLAIAGAVSALFLTLDQAPGASALEPDAVPVVELADDQLPRPEVVAVTPAGLLADAGTLDGSDGSDEYPEGEDDEADDSDEYPEGEDDEADDSDEYPEGEDDDDLEEDDEDEEYDDDDDEDEEHEEHEDDLDEDDEEDDD